MTDRDPVGEHSRRTSIVGNERRTPRLVRIACGTALLAVLGAGTADAQEFRNPMVPVLDRRIPVGELATWNAVTQRVTPGYMQPVRLSLETGGRVDVFRGRPDDAAEFAAPAQFAIEFGRVYRLRVSGLEGYEGVELFPTIELVDHLHPPAGRKDEFPVMVEIDRVDVELALRGRLVTKVVYLEQPQVASPLGADGYIPPRDLDPRANALTEADRRGRPIAVLRMGGRIPSPNLPDPTFFATGGTTVQPSQAAPPVTPAPAREAVPQPGAPNGGAAAGAR